MYQFKMLTPLDTMERITRQDLCDNFDKVLERVDKEDIGFVILTEDGKDGQVLCPARWMEYCFDDDVGCIINSALRYAICRHTYMPNVVVDFIRKYINILNAKTIAIAIDDITRELEENNVDEPAMWIDLKKELGKRLVYLRERAAVAENQNKNED